MYLFAIFLILALFFAFMGTACLAIYRIFEKSRDKIAIAEAAFIEIKTVKLLRGQRGRCAVYEYMVNGKKYVRTIDVFFNPPKKSEVKYLKSFPRIAYIRAGSNDFSLKAFMWFGIAAVFLAIAIFCLYKGIPT